MENNNNTTKNELVQLVLSKKDSTFLITLPSGNVYQYSEQLLSIDHSKKSTTFKTGLRLVSKNYIDRFKASFKMMFRQGELKGLTLDNIEIITGLSQVELDKNAAKLHAILNHLSVKNISFRNERYNKGMKEDDKQIWKFIPEAFMADLKVMCN